MMTRLVWVWGAVCTLGGCEPEPLCPVGQVPATLAETETRCVPAECGSGPWGDEASADGAFFVAPGADGDGSEDSPFGSLSDALRGAEGRASTVYLASNFDGSPAVYGEQIETGAEHDGVHVQGRCRGLVSIEGGGDEDGEAVWTHRGGDLEVRSLTITNGFRGIDVFGDPEQEGRHRMVVRDVAVRDVLAIGIRAVAADADVWNSAISGVRQPEGQSLGSALEARAGGRIRAADTTISEIEGIAVQSVSGAVLELERVTVRDVRPQDDGRFGWGADARSSSTLLVTDSTFSDLREVGILVRDGSDGTLTDVTIERVLQGRPDGLTASLDVVNGGTATATRLTVREFEEYGLHMWGASELTLIDSTIRDGRAVDAGLNAGEGGIAVWLEDGATLLATNVELLDNQDLGLWATGSGTLVDLTGGVISGTTPAPMSLQSGRGVEIARGAQLLAAGTRFSENTNIAVRVAGVDPSTGDTARAELTGCVIEGTLPGAEGMLGRGLSVELGAEVLARGTSILANHEVGVTVLDPGSFARFLGGRIEGTEPRPGLGTAGFGLQVAGGAHVESGCWDEAPTGPDCFVITDNTGVGVSVADATAALVDTVISNTNTGPNGLGGQGLSAQDSAVVDVLRGTIEGNSTTSVLSTDGALIRLEGTTVWATQATTRPGGGVGLQPQAAGVIEVVDVDVKDCTGPGAYLVTGGRLVGSDLRLSGNRFAGAVVFDGELEVERLAVSETLPDPEAQLAMGLFTSAELGPPRVDLSDSNFSALPEGCAVLRGPGSFVFRETTFEDCGAPGLAPALYALEGVGVGAEGPTNPGLLLAGSQFRGLAGDAVVLDESSARLAANPATSTPNTFVDVDGEMIWQQGCESAEPVVVTDGSVAAPACGAARILNFSPSFAIYIDDAADVIGR